MDKFGNSQAVLRTEDSRFLTGKGKTGPNLWCITHCKHAKTQNECIVKTFRTDGTNNAGIPSKVWSCNGGGD